MKLKTLLLSLLLTTSLIGVAYADFQDGWKAYQAKDYATAIKEWKPIAGQMPPIAQTLLGWMYKYGGSTLKDDKQSVYWFRRAAEQGNANAQNELGGIYAYGEGVLKDPKQAHNWYSKAAEQGYPDAQYNLGLMYQHGDDVVKDMTKAKYWLKKAYEGDDAETSKTAEKFWNKYELWR
jgi:TPR repeat protein